MKLTKREDYTFFLMSKLAKFYDKKLVALSEISNEFGISAFFLKQLVRPLIKSGLLISKEGVGGGYSLAKPPKEISMYEVFLAMSTLPTLTSCCLESERIKCQRVPFCKPGKVWGRINKGILKELEKTKLSQLA